MSYETRFSASLGVFAFGVAGFVSMYVGASALTSLYRAALAGAAFFVFGRILAVIIFNGPIPIPGGPKQAPPKEKERKS